MKTLETLFTRQFSLSRRRAMSYVEVLMAVLILAIVSAGAVATWNLSSKIPGNKRVTDMASIIAVREIERVKGKKYLNVADGTTITYYGKFGAETTVTAERVFAATTVVSVVINRDAITNTEDLRQIVVTVQNAAGTKTYETQRTLIAFGGV